MEKKKNWTNVRWNTKRVLPNCLEKGNIGNPLLSLKKEENKLGLSCAKLRSNCG
jgi:hypothetical protein